MMMQTELWPIDRPIPYGNNPRQNAGAILKVADSLQEFGWKQPIVVDRDGVVIVGHTRLAAARELGWTEVPVVVASGLTPQQAKAYRIADNRTHEESSWDTLLLRLEIEDLLAEGYDTELTGFDTAELTTLLEPPAEEPPAPEEEKHTLAWDGRQPVAITAEEAAALSAALDRYLNTNGLAYGFVRSLFATEQEAN